jgi:predicted ATPase/transcriptional regulator with XRE-family HTH domain
MPNAEEPIPFGPLLRQQRIAAGLTQEALAERTGLGVRSIQHLEGGAHLPHRETIDRLIKALGLSGEERSRFERVAKPAPRQRASAAVSTGEAPSSDTPSRTSRYDLPVPLTSFVGRTRDVDEVQRLLLRAEVRLVTLTGPGGVGKTRLSLAVAERVLEAFPDGVAFIPLGAVRESGVVGMAIGQALGARASGERPAEAVLRELLRDRALLMELDNLEQIEDAPLLIASLLGACPRLKVLATSRRALQLSGEHEYLVHPLDLPDLARLPSVDSLGHDGAVRLFLERARAMRPELVLDDENVRAIAEICVRLDGLPLAIELAAARVRLLPPVALRDRLVGPHPSARLRLLNEGARDLPFRQRSLRDTVKWSHDLLMEGQRRLFRRLAVFVGSFGIAAAEAVGVALGDNADEILGALESLVRDGLLGRSETDGREPRLALLETIREFALEKLGESGELAAVQRAHAAYYAALAEEASLWLRTGEQLIWLARLDAEQVNLRAALTWTTTADVALGLRLVAGAWDYYDLRIRTNEIVESALLLIAQSDTPELAEAPERRRAMAHMICAADWSESLAVRRALAEDCLKRCRAVGDRPGMARALYCIADRLIYDEREPLRAMTLLDEGLDLARKVGDTWMVGRILTHRGRVAWDLGDLPRARAEFAEGLAHFRRAGDRWGIAYALGFLGSVARAEGAYVEAEAHLAEDLALARSIESPVWEGVVLALLSQLAVEQGDGETARVRLNEAVTLARERARRWDVLGYWRASINVRRGRDETWAALVHEASLTLLDEIDLVDLSLAELFLLGFDLADWGEVTRPRALFQRALATSESRNDSTLVARALLGLACVAEAATQGERGAHLLGASQALTAVAESRLDVTDHAKFDHCLGKLQAQLSTDRFAIAWSEGQRMTRAQAVVYALDDRDLG